MTPIVPGARPELGRHAAEEILHAMGVTGPALLGRRGYYRDTMGRPGVNDRGLYDDAIFVVTPTAFVAFNANTDPSQFRPGIAVLKSGVWQYKLGIHGLTRPAHQQYQALVQAGPVTVVRDGRGDDTGWFGINIHRGGYSSTSSEGCQTIHPEQWESFIALVKGELQRHGLMRIPYALSERGAA